MNRILKTALYIAIAFAAFSCAKAVEEAPNEANIRYFNSWMKLNHPNARPTGLGIYVLEEEEGTGPDIVKKDGFVILDYIVTDLEGNISEYTDKHTAKQLGTYDTTYYYGPKVMTTIEQTLPAGVADALIGMKTGGRKKVIIPSWLMSYYAYSTEQEYIDNASTSSSAIYDITVHEFADTITNFEISRIEKYIAENADIFKNVENDTTGFYFQTLEEGQKDEKFEGDTTIYINYTGKLLNGLVFDTTIEKIAKDNGIYSSSRTYEPASVKWSENWSEITLRGSSVVSGFALTLSHMNPMGKGIGIFYSPMGYSNSGNGRSIPGYMPLVFEIETVEKPED